MSEDHSDGGLFPDFQRMMTRRSTLRRAALVGSGFLLAGCDAFGPPSHAETNRTATAADGSLCIKDPAETNGPFPADGSNAHNGATLNVLRQDGLIREDIRGSFGGMTPVAQGAALEIEIRLVDVAKACAPLANHLIYIWHCDALGRYSLYNDEDRNYLRGAGVTDAQGLLKFTSIFPGCYDGRWPHIHFEVFASPASQLTAKDSLLVSQFALPATDAQKLYSSRKDYGESLASLGHTSMESDNLFGDNTPEQNAAMTLNMSGDPAAGYKATVTVGIASS